MADNKFLEIGKIVGVHGIKGEVKVQSLCDSLDIFCCIKNMYLDVKSPPLVTECMRIHKNHILVKFCGIDFRDQAENLRGNYLYAQKCDIPIEEGRYFIEDLKNSEVFDFKSGKRYGILKNVWNAGANDIYTVVNNSGEEYYVPIIEGTIKDIDLEKNKILITPIEGIFD